MLTNILVPALGLILLTFVIGLIHTIASVDLMGKGKDWEESGIPVEPYKDCLLYTSPSPRDRTRSRMPSSA